MVQGADQSLATQQAIEADLIAFFDARRMKVEYSDVAIEDRNNASAQFSILTQLLMMMTVLMAIVGSMGLSGTLSINVIERRREIGVMRAVGASSRDVAFIFAARSLGLQGGSLPCPSGLRPVCPGVGGDRFPAEYYPATHGVWLWNRHRARLSQEIPPDEPLASASTKVWRMNNCYLNENCPSMFVADSSERRSLTPSWSAG
jgi:hypothetical protein